MRAALPLLFLTGFLFLIASASAATWHSVETWNVNVQGIGSWHTAETWNVNVVSSTPYWRSVETWLLNVPALNQTTIIFNVTGVGSDYGGIVVDIDGLGYRRDNLPTYFFWDNGTTHSFVFVNTFNGAWYNYEWANTTGLDTARYNYSFVAVDNGNVTAAYTSSLLTYPAFHDVETWHLYVYGSSPSALVIEPNVYFALPKYNYTTVWFTDNLFCDNVTWNEVNASAVSFTNAYMTTGTQGPPITNFTVSIWDTNTTNYQNIFGISQVPYVKFTSLSNTSLSFYFLAPINTQVCISISNFPREPRQVNINGQLFQRDTEWFYNDDNGTVTFTIPFWSIVGAPEYVVMDWTSVFHTVDTWTINVYATKGFHATETWHINAQTSGEPELPGGGTIAPALPFMFIFGMVGLVCMSLGPAYGVYKMKRKHAFVGGLLFAIIFFSVGVSLCLAWLWSVPPPAVSPVSGNPQWRTVETWNMTRPANPPLGSADLYVEDYRGWTVFQTRTTTGATMYYATSSDPLDPSPSPLFAWVHIDAQHPAAGGVEWFINMAESGGQAG